MSEYITISSRPSKSPTVHDGPDYYNGYEKRGRCVIFAHKTFDNPRISERTGQEPRKIDFKKDQIETTLIKLSRRKHKNTDCLVLCISTHGNPEQLHAKDGPYDSKLFFEYLNAKSYPSLAGKPKLLFIQACRGKQKDEGFEIDLCYFDKAAKEEAGNVVDDDLTY
ncbi:caspase-1-like [Panonychus citri]|uniref:caspase-1-like n=1 Tax=Panonychus citri TaxID=50023 RepID=UPI00230780FB|nr:caspase-1-like [Panonychus citri]